ncbi:SCO family protein [Mesorhizobium australicum]|uniref:Protein SCO1/2 n=1 Tax=Mesorhizobium australicum TaxID=536018 RepID=A0A1X7MQ19_9HYPH|nr:SCO family protein [Mesorhizobium australicum]SMH26136.1 protein SCO1/2 [Mesorhizobium australicum]
MSGVKIFRIATWVAVAIVAGIWIGFSGILPGTGREQEPVSTGTAAIGGQFELTSHKGETVNNAKLASKPYLVFFGFTHCPDICPTTLFELTDLMGELGPLADRLTPLFITVDPERDTQDLLASYMTSFDERIIALRGDRAQTDRAVKAFAAYYRKVPTEGGGYTMDHTAGVILMDADGRFAGTLDMHEPRETVLAKLKRLAGA